jgi:cytochrome P450
MSSQQPQELAIEQAIHSHDQISLFITEVMSDLSAPQQRYYDLMDKGFISMGEGFGVTFGREDTQFIARNHEAFSTREEVSIGNVRPLIPLNVDPPLHAKFRKILAPMFSYSRMKRQEEHIALRVNRFIDSFIEQGHCNFSKEFADPFPSSVFLGLMGLPEEELPMFLAVRDGIMRPELTEPAAATDRVVRARIITAAGENVYRYFGEIIEARSALPTDDFISTLIASEIDGEPLSVEQILDICYFLLVAGLDTVGNTLTCSFAFLAKNSQHRQMIVDDPAIIPNAVEELFRWEAPSPATLPRIVTRPVELPSGTRLEKGMRVLPHWGAANLDVETFGDPMTVRFDRKINPHFSFGTGAHNCLGSSLARVELATTLREWHRRIPDYAIKQGHEALEYPPGLRHVSNLVLAWPTN